MDAATAAAAGAVAIVDDLRCEVKENRDVIVTAVRIEEVEPLCLEVREAFAERDEKFEALKVHVLLTLPNLMLWLVIPVLWQN